MTLPLVLQHGLDDDAAEASYLESLNRSFPGWGGRDLFDWCFRRVGAGRPPHMLRLFLDKRAVAGIALVYRNVTLHGCMTVLTAILSGAWTDPELRGSGAFTRLVRAARETAAANDASIILAFVTAHNASRRRMESAGSDLSPTFYCRSTAGSPVLPSDLLEAEAATLAAPIARPSPGHTQFAYTDDDWREQFLRRPGDVRQVASSTGWTALVERASGFDRLLALDADTHLRPAAHAALTARAHASGRQLFVFTTDPIEADVLRQQRFEIVDGYITTLVSDECLLRRVLAHSPYAVPDDQPIRDAGWWPRLWSVQNGDRM